MGDPSPYIVASWLASEVHNEEFRPLLECVIEVLNEHRPGQSVEERAEFAEEILPSVVAAIDQKQVEANEDGIVIPLELSVDAGTPYLRALKRQADETLDKLLLLTDKQFEEFCGTVLTKMTCQAEVRGNPHDGGVDFVGHDLALYPQATRGARILVIGQAKHYKRSNFVSVTDLREFVGGAVHMTSDPSESMFRRQILAPVMYAFWTSSDFHPSARKYARELGLWYLSGIALAQLANRLGVQIP